MVKVVPNEKDEKDAKRSMRLRVYPGVKQEAKLGAWLYIAHGFRNEAVSYLKSCRITRARWFAKHPLLAAEWTPEEFDKKEASLCSSWLTEQLEIARELASKWFLVSSNKKTVGEEFAQVWSHLSRQERDEMLWLAHQRSVFLEWLLLPRTVLDQVVQDLAKTLSKAISDRTENKTRRSAGFVMAGEKMLASILTRSIDNQLTSDRKIQWAERLFRSSFAPDPRYPLDDDPRATTPLDYVMYNETFDFIPFLHEAGYALSDTLANRFSMADHVSHGRWPFPDLLLPGFMLDENTRNSFFLFLRKGAFSPTNFLSSYEHVQRFCQLPMPDRAAVRKMMMSVLEDNQGSAFQILIPVSPEAAHCLILLHDNQLLDLGALLENQDLPPVSAHLVEATRPEIAARHLQSQTTTPSLSRGLSPRL